VAELIAVDLGGTHIRVARFASASPPPAAQSKIATRTVEGPEAVVARMIEAIEGLVPAPAPDLRIGIGSPGPLDPYKGVILAAPNLPGWADFPLRQRIADHFGCPVGLANDANLAALGEWRFGAGRGYRDLLYVTLSTGIGGGVIIDGRMLVGHRGLAAELGHMTLDRKGPMCGCGHRGHLEALASGPAIVRRAAARLTAGEPSSLADLQRSGAPLTAEAVGQAARQGDPMALAVVNEAAEATGCHLASLAHAFNPEVIVLGGGVVQIGEPLLARIEEALRAEIIHPAYLEGLRLASAELGDDAGLFGAMVLASEL